MVDNTIALQVRPLDIATPLMQAAKMRQMESEQQQQQQANDREQTAAAMRGLAPYADSPEFAGRWQQTIDDLAQRGHVRPDIAARMRDNPSQLQLRSVLAQAEDPRLALQRQQVAQSGQQFQQTHALHEKQFALSQQQADLAAKGFDYKEVDDGNGNKVLVRIEKATGNVTRPPIAGMPTEPENPYAPQGKITEDEAKSRGFAARMVTSHNMITGNEKINEGTMGAVGGMAAAAPHIRDSHMFNMVASDGRQKAIQAQRNFVNALLRRESGAAISQGEFENAQRQYFPMPGDGPQVLAEKRLNRQQAIEGIMQGAGRGYKPPADYMGTKGPAVKGAPDKGANDGPEISAAREAIAKGAPRAAVEARLQQNGVKFSPADLDLQ